MGHIDLYRAWGLDRDTDCNALARQLGDRLADPANTGLFDQLRTAQGILGVPQRRAIYDQRLADPSGPPLDEQALVDLAATPPGPATPGLASALPSTKILLGIVAILVVAVIAAVTALLVSGDDDGTAGTAAPGTSTPFGQSQPKPADSTEQSHPAVPVAPIPGAYPGAGGPRPAEAEPLPTYVSRYGRLTSAHLLTPTGGIGCDFTAPAPSRDGHQGQCGVRSMSGSNSPLGCVQRVGTCKGKWLFQLSKNRVGDPVDSSGTTGWMNQPANDGYHVPRVQYGKQYYFEDWAIASEMNGLTVWNTATGSGVFLSNEKAETFDGPGGASAPAGSGGDETVVLGSMPSNGRGYGTAKPVGVYAGGDPTSRITDITWTTWGGETAEGTGTGTWREDGRVGREQYIPATVVVSDIGMCNGKRAYMKINWYFPSKGETIDSRSSMKTCWDS